MAEMMKGNVAVAEAFILETAGSGRNLYSGRE